MVEDYRIELIQMMENAGRNLASLARSRFLDNDPRGKHILVMAGSGGNGGGGMVAARRLANWGAKVGVYLTRGIDMLSGVTTRQLQILQNIGVPITPPHQIDFPPHTDLILDSIIGYSLRGAPRNAAAHLIRLANASQIPILSLDVPSGVDTTTGESYDPHIQAQATLTLALPKTGLMNKKVSSAVGELYLADISVPPRLYASLGLEVDPIFAQEEIIRVY